ncbi:MAG: AAA family ATPase [Pseudomonadota bacterium]|nr:MAG: hypothetical protein DIU56_14855 [Pseudomonadota bacterium]
MNATLPPPLQGLLSPRAYAHPVTRIEVVETHVSWVLMTGELAYKLKKPVRFPFLDFSTPELRARFCDEELRLNRRFAPGLYISVVPVTRTADGEVRMGGEGERIDSAVCMRQFDSSQELDRLLAAGSIEPAELREFGAELADIHAKLPVAKPDDGFGTPRRIRDTILANLEECLDACRDTKAAARLFELRAPLTEALEKRAALMQERLVAGRVRECHGDLHTRNVVRLEGRLVAFDCLEFDPALRWIDVADELSFLFSDLLAESHPGHAHALLDGYLERSGDHQACLLLAPYGAHRALVRAKVSALSARGTEDGTKRSELLTRVEAYVRCARELLAPARPMLVLTSGLSGSGKTWLARRLAPRLRAVHLRSDVERRRGREAAAQNRGPSEPGAGRYTRAATAQVYARLAERARDVLGGGISTIVDATFLRREDRMLFRELAHALQVPLFVVRCTAPDRVLRERIESRMREGNDPSEADVAVLDWQLGRQEPIEADEGLAVIEADTTSDTVLAHVLAALSRGAAADAAPG